MTEPTDAETWWQSLDHERRQVWIIHITGWTLRAVVHEAYRRACGEDRAPVPPGAEPSQEAANA